MKYAVNRRFYVCVVPDFNKRELEYMNPDIN